MSRLRKELDLALYSRFPLTWIMEAADDISYCVADLEDAVEKSIFSAEQLYQHLYERGASMKKVRYFRHALGEIASQLSEAAARKISFLCICG